MDNSKVFNSLKKIVKSSELNDKKKEQLLNLLNNLNNKK